MIDILQAEFLKQKKSTFALLCTIMVLSVQIVLIAKDMMIGSVPDDTEWIYTLILMNSLILSIMSGFFITFLMQREYQDRTLINILNAPVSRVSFIVAKLLVWAMWYIITACLVAVVIVIGYRLVYPASFGWSGVQLIFLLVAKNSGFLFVASLPVLWITVLQRTLFYPSLLVTFIFTVIAIAGTQTSMGMLKLAIAVPWSAASIASLMSASSIYFWIAVLSVFLSGIIGTVLTIYSFVRQDQ
ncbi:ABC transporter permease [Bacillus sp. AGMB 02131]|uniref:ABC transporter permease n=1 Tax=Peribacillus faecalis TaxID=2772559 RepID=A0A927CVS2_9BACI|nr:ABC transporter permease [Peribacillus faecalis]MBD3108421.1 ABC transporter permease [Peribacillus faecalis]